MCLGSCELTGRIISMCIIVIIYITIIYSARGLRRMITLRFRAVRMGIRFFFQRAKPIACDAINEYPIYDVYVASVYLRVRKGDKMRNKNVNHIQYHAQLILLLYKYCTYDIWSKHQIVDMTSFRVYYYNKTITNQRIK